MNKIKKQQQGQSLLEMVFAIGVLLIVVAGILALAIANIIGQKESESQILANNLAREAIEVARNIRDSNWLAGNQWDAGLTDAASNIAIVNYHSQALQFDPTEEEKQLFISAVRVYSHDDSGEPSIFTRELILNSICQNIKSGDANFGEEIIKDACLIDDEKKVGIKIQAQVSWLERNRDRIVTLENLLYEWK